MLCKGLGAPLLLSTRMWCLRSDPCAFALVMKVLTWTSSVWEWMFINTLWPLWRTHLEQTIGQCALYLAMMLENFAQATGIFFFIFITAQCFHPAYPLHPPPTINNLDRCRDSTAFLVCCFQTGIPTIFKDRDTCASVQALLTEWSAPTASHWKYSQQQCVSGIAPRFSCV